MKLKVTVFVSIALVSSVSFSMDWERKRIGELLVTEETKIGKLPRYSLPIPYEVKKVNKGRFPGTSKVKK